MKLNANRPNALASWSSKIIKLLGLFLVMLVVWNVCQSRLASLRSDRAAGMSGYVSAEEKLKQLDCLTRNIYWEAASEPFEGKVAVAQVTLNRVESGRFAPTVCGVVYQKECVLRKSSLPILVVLRRQPQDPSSVSAHGARKRTCGQKSTIGELPIAQHEKCPILSCNLCKSQLAQATN